MSLGDPPEPPYAREWTDEEREEFYVLQDVIALTAATGSLDSYIREHIGRLRRQYKTPQAIARRIRVEAGVEY